MINNTDTAQKTINLSYLESISSGNKEFVKEMVNLFLSENPEEIKSLENAITEKNHKSIKTIAHKLRSTIPFMGLDKIIEKDVAEIEKLAANNADVKEIEQRFAKVKEVCEKSYYELSPI